jgi:uncharacterized membrane protein YcaP (DUF421 family)
MSAAAIFSSLSPLVSAIDRALGLGLKADDLGFSHMALRAVAVFGFSLVLMGVSVRRLLGRNAALDVMLVVILGSVLSRAINGQASFYPTLGASLVLVLLHRLVAWLGLRSHAISLLSKGRDRVLVRDGRVDHGALREVMMTHDDLLENLRLNGKITQPSEVKEARLERSGTVSVIKRSG